MKRPSARKALEAYRQQKRGRYIGLYDQQRIEQARGALERLDAAEATIAATKLGIQKEQYVPPSTEATLEPKEAPVTPTKPSVFPETPETPQTPAQRTLGLSADTLMTASTKVGAGFHGIEDAQSHRDILIAASEYSAAARALTGRSMTEKQNVRGVLGTEIKMQHMLAAADAIVDPDLRATTKLEIAKEMYKIGLDIAETPPRPASDPRPYARFDQDGGSAWKPTELSDRLGRQIRKLERLASADAPPSALSAKLGRQIQKTEALLSADAVASQSLPVAGRAAAPVSSLETDVVPRYRGERLMQPEPQLKITTLNPEAIAKSPAAMNSEGGLVASRARGSAPGGQMSTATMIGVSTAAMVGTVVGSSLVSAAMNRERQRYQMEYQRRLTIEPEPIIDTREGTMRHGQI